MKYNLFLQNKIKAANRIIGLEEHYEILPNRQQTHYICFLKYNRTDAEKCIRKLKQYAEEHGVIATKDVLKLFNSVVDNPEDGWTEDVGVPMNEFLDSQPNPLPLELQTPQAQQLLRKMIEHGVLDSNYQPVSLSATYKALWADELSQRLGIRNKWIVFGKLWGYKAETMRNKYNEAWNKQKTTSNRIKEIRHVLG